MSDPSVEIVCGPHYWDLTQIQFHLHVEEVAFYATYKNGFRGVCEHATKANFTHETEGHLQLHSKICRWYIDYPNWCMWCSFPKLILFYQIEISECCDFYRVILYSCPFTIQFNKIDACSKVFVECIICLVEFKEVSSPPSSSFVSSSSSFRLAPLTLKASPKSKDLKRACIESWVQHFDTLGSRNPRSSSDANFIA